MKKKIVGVIAFVAMAMIVGYSAHTSKRNVKLSDLTLANVEALANLGEVGPNWNLCQYYGCVFSFYHDCHVYQNGMPITTCENSRG